MSPEKREYDHGLRQALRTDSKPVAAALARWEPVPKTGHEATVEKPRLKDTPQLGSEEERSGAISTGLDRAVSHMHAAEEGKAKSVVGAKTYGLAIMHEVFDMGPETIGLDGEALSDLTEYLLAMLYEEKGIYLRGGAIEPALQDDPDVQLAQSILSTWELPDREFNPPFMYQRVDWK